MSTCLQRVAQGAARRFRLLPLAAALALAGCAATRLHDEGMRLASDGQRDKAIDLLEQAHRLEPTDARFEIDLLKERIAFSRELAQRGDRARDEERPGDAVELYERALRLNGDNLQASAGLSTVRVSGRVGRIAAEAERLLQEGRPDAAQAQARRGLELAPSDPALLRLRAQADEAVEKAAQARAAQAAQKSLLKKTVSLQFRDAGVKMVFEALSKTTGLNVIFDRDVKPDLKTTIFVQNAAVEDAIDLILMQSQLEKRMLNPSSIFVYPATAAKLKEYQDLQLKTFQVTNADPKYLQTLLKGVLKLKDVSYDERSGMMVVRDTPEGINLATKLIAAHDVPDAEVMLEVQVLEVSSDRVKNLGLQLPDSVSVTVPGSSPSVTTQTGAGLGAMTRSQLVVSQLSATLNLKLQDIDARLLASPRIRTRNKEKAKILIGDRVPTIANTVTPVTTGTPVITGSVSYQEVGLKLEVEPTVFSDNDVGIKMALEVSNIVQAFTDAQGGRSYQIGTRNAQTNLRLHDGETQILGGLISDQDRNTASKIPGLGQLPIAGRLFSNENGDHVKTEIVLSITPHLVRGLARSDPDLRDIFIGTEASLRDHPMRLETAGEIRLPAAAKGPEAAPGAGPAGAGATATAAPVPAAPGRLGLNAAPPEDAAQSPAQQLRNQRRPQSVPYMGIGQVAPAPAAAASAARAGNPP